MNCAFDQVAKTVRLHSQDPSATESIANLVAPPESTMLIDLVTCFGNEDGKLPWRLH